MGQKNQNLNDRVIIMSKKILRITVLILLLIGVGIILYGGLFQQVTTADIPKDVPIIHGKVVSIKTFRSDELKRGISIVVETNAALPEVARYYTEEFDKRSIRALDMPTIWGNSTELETSTEASGIGETQNHNQIVVSIQSEHSLTLVEISILGNSYFSLPK